MKTYQIQLLNCNNHNIEISKYLQIMTEIPKEDADQIVSNVPVVLYENLDEECTGYFETALDYYQAEYLNGPPQAVSRKAAHPTGPAASKSGSKPVPCPFRTDREPC